MSISVTALRVAAIYRLPLGRLEALKSLVWWVIIAALLRYLWTP